MRLIALFFVAAVVALSCEAAEPDRATIPLPEPAFEGKIGKTYEDSEGAWPRLPTPPAGAPNVVVILLDDVGFGQTGTFGGPIPTPSLDKLAANGPFASVLKGDLKTALAGGEKALMEMMAATHSGMTTEEFEKSVTAWLATAKHPVSGKSFTDMVYQPMLELLAYLRANGFKMFIVSGGGIEFMRVWTEKVYGIPPEQVVGTSGGLKYELRDGTPVIVKTLELAHYDDKEGKPVGIQRHIGRRPVMAVGNSDGDFEMLEWTTSGNGPRFGLIVHHTDADREWAYNRKSHIGRLPRGLDEGPNRGWTIVSMKDDWKMIFSEK
jgi:phosphoserine phosphatase